MSLLSFPLPRLNSLLVQLPLPDGPGRLLDVGCGDCPAALTLRHALPGWTIYGLDLDPGELRRAHLRAADLRLICADASHLPGLLRQRFGLILVRHPDLSLRRRAWSRIIPRLPLSLAPGGVLSCGRLGSHSRCSFSAASTSRTSVSISPARAPNPFIRSVSASSAARTA